MERFLPSVVAHTSGSAEVVVADNLVTGYRQAVPEKAKFYLGDVRDRDFMDWVFTKEKIDVVIHSIHAPREDEDTERPLSYYDNDFYGTKVTLDTMVDHGVQSIVFCPPPPIILMVLYFLPDNASRDSTV